MDLIKNFARPEIQKHIFGEGQAIIEQNNEYLLVTQRKFKYSSLAVNLLTLLGDYSGYRGQYVLRLKEKDAQPVTLHLYYKITMEYLGLESTSYYCAADATVTGKEWTVLSGLWSKIEGARLVSLVLYFVQDEEIFPDIEIKELTVEGGEFQQEIKSTVVIPPIKRSKKTTFGVIRWDAYFTTNETASNVSQQVAKALSPAQYHFMAPYFSVVKDKNTLVFDKADQAQFDQEAELAVKAGIDYFAYCWYCNHDPMSYARRQHMVSQYRDKIKMCAIINVHSLDEETFQELYFCMRQKYYFTISGRPVIFVYDGFRAKPELIQKIKKEALEAGVTENIYFVAMAGTANPIIISSLLDNGFEAISAYSCGAEHPGESYKALCAKDRMIDTLKYQYSDRIGIIPHITCGRDTRPRLENPVSWAGDYGGYYTLTGTPQEIYAHAAEVLGEIRKNPGANMPNSVLVYAWNEHDEGGWCCPTLTVDKEGMPLLDTNGKNKKNTAHLDALAKALREHRQQEE
mgnify:CR=1 FL=1